MSTSESTAKNITTMKDFQVIEVKSIWLSLSGKVWRFQYRTRRKFSRLIALMVYRLRKSDACV